MFSHMVQAKRVLDSIEAWHEKARDMSLHFIYKKNGVVFIIPPVAQLPLHYPIYYYYAINLFFIIKHYTVFHTFW